MIYRLIFLCGPRTGEQATIGEEPFVIGRDASCALCVDDAEMAVRHAVLEQKGDELFIRDLGSMNRILLNKREVRESRVKHGDEFELGRSRFVVHALVQAEVPAGVRPARRKRRHAAWAVAALAALGLLFGLSMRHRPPESATAPAAQETKPAAEDPVASSTPAHPDVSVDLRGLREDILAIRETVRAMVDRPAPTASAPVVAAPVPTVTVPAATPPRPSGPVLKIANVQQMRFPDAGDYDEMRMFALKLVPVQQGDPLDRSLLRVEFSFFDRDADTGEVVPSAAEVTTQEEPAGPDWGRSVTRVATATYLAPNGTRDAETRPRRVFHGYRVRVFYEDVLQDEACAPHKLAQAFPAP